MNQFLALDNDFNQMDVVTNSRVITTALRAARAPLIVQLGQLHPRIQEFADVVQRMHIEIQQENANPVQVNNLHDKLMLLINVLRPQITAACQLITELLNQIRQIRTLFQNQIAEIRNQLNQQQTLIVTNIITARDTRNRIATAEQTIQTRI